MLESVIEQKLPEIIDCFLGAFARDILPKIKRYPACLIVNFDKHWQPGSHWVAIYLDKNKFGTYFDSFGLPPLHKEIINFFDNYSHGFVSNKLTLQCTECVTCGDYASVFLILRSFGWTNHEILSLFTSDRYANDNIVKILFQHLTDDQPLDTYLTNLKRP